MRWLVNKVGVLMVRQFQDYLFVVNSAEFNITCQISVTVAFSAFRAQS